MPEEYTCRASWSSERNGATRARARPLTNWAITDYTVRYSRRVHNAGHTLVVGGNATRCTCCRPGILNPNSVPVIGNGAVDDLDVLFDEIDARLERQGGG